MRVLGFGVNLPIVMVVKEINMAMQGTGRTKV